MSTRVARAVILATYDCLKDGRAVLRLADGQELFVAPRSLPSGSRVGQILELHVHTPETAQADHRHLARAVLEEILNG